MGRILLLSNGHGEDLSGSLLGSALRALGHEVTALPLAGLGSPYSQAKIPLLGSSHEFSTGGIGYTSLQGRLRRLTQLGTRPLGAALFADPSTRRMHS